MAAWNIQAALVRPILQIFDLFARVREKAKVSGRQPSVAGFVLLHATGGWQVDSEMSKFTKSGLDLFRRCIQLMILDKSLGDSAPEWFSKRGNVGHLSKSI